MRMIGSQSSLSFSRVSISARLDGVEIDFCAQLDDADFILNA
jgi:hypothetical protein